MFLLQMVLFQSEVKLQDSMHGNFYGTGVATKKTGITHDNANYTSMVARYVHTRSSHFSTCSSLGRSGPFFGRYSYNVVNPIITINPKKIGDDSYHPFIVILGMVDFWVYHIMLTHPNLKTKQTGGHN